MKVVGSIVLAAAITASFGAQVSARDLDPCFGRRPTIVGTEGSDTLRGTNGADVIFAAGGDDTIYSREGDDRVCGGTGNDVIQGDSGNDSLFGATGVDRIFGGDGEDEMYSGGSSTAELELLDGGSGDDKISGESSPEEMHGGIGSDVLMGGGSLLNVPDQLFGDADDDRLSGRQSMLSGGQGDDVMADGTISFAESLGPVEIDLSSGMAVGEGNDELQGVKDAVGSAFDDEIVGDNANNDLQGGPGDDVMDGGEGNDTVDAGEGDDACTEQAESTNCEAFGSAGEIAAGQPAEDSGSKTVIWAIAGGTMVLGGLLALVFMLGRKKAAAVGNEGA